MRTTFLCSFAPILLALFACSQTLPTPDEVPCKGAASCNALGTESLNRGDIPAAIKLFSAEVGFSEDAQNKAQSLTAYHNLAIAYLRNQDYFRALSWVHLALRIDPENKAAKFNLRKIEGHISDHKWPADISGLYVRYSGREQWDSVHLSKPRGSDLSFHLLAYRMGLAWRRYGPGSYGDVDGTATLVGNHQAVFKDSDFPTCRITMHFKEDGVSVEQEGDCGFGYGVQATGAYERICSDDDKECDEKHLP